MYLDLDLDESMYQLGRPALVGLQAVAGLPTPGLSFASRKALAKGLCLILSAVTSSFW